ncbi:hypothetical protein [Methyloversatilis sp. XJ19-49]|uniref:hypothetical protein n=1 Tax=Methyloversatilis sp. XJ19-49 TaxID=2963429 RepID=UPI00211D1515|nr:hypothetical protein [Methyloversatilis sp. XJ19-49]MCQ9379886.1 hypothetical protein [Methyloversatilis sp. XJ19-49]
MKNIRNLSLALALSAIGAHSWAAEHDHHEGHHAKGSADASKSMPGKTSPEMARMANHMKAMQDMHGKMMNAKTPEERNSLMGEHMKMMHEGMGMMTGMGGMADSKNPTTMGHRQNMMEHRMDMMQNMMQMMIDRLPQTPAKP